MYARTQQTTNGTHAHVRTPRTHTRGRKIRFSGSFGGVDSGGGHNKSSYAALTNSSSAAGLLSTSNPVFFSLACVYVGVKILAINSLLPARDFVFIIPANGLLQVVIVLCVLWWWWWWWWWWLLVVSGGEW
jgi:hypothetical protein